MTPKQKGQSMEWHLPGTPRHKRLDFENKKQSDIDPWV
jgi:hypothetical protein